MLILYVYMFVSENLDSISNRIKHMSRLLVIERNTITDV